MEITQNNARLLPFGTMAISLVLAPKPAADDLPKVTVLPGTTAQTRIITQVFSPANPAS